jgi:hypothetical protein
MNTPEERADVYLDIAEAIDEKDDFISLALLRRGSKLNDIPELEIMNKGEFPMYFHFGKKQEERVFALLFAAEMCEHPSIWA